MVSFFFAKEISRIKAAEAIEHTVVPLSSFLVLVVPLPAF